MLTYKKSISTNNLENIADNQPCWMVVPTTPKFKESDYFAHREGVGDVQSECFNYHALYVSFNAMNAFYCAMKVLGQGLLPERFWVGVCFQMLLDWSLLVNAPLQTRT